MSAVPRSLWAEPRPPDVPVRVWRDWMLVAVLLPTAVLEGLLRPDLPFRWLQVAVVAGLVPLLLWRRTRPLLVLVVFFATAGVLAVLTGDPDGMYSAAFGLLLPYALVRWGSGREALGGLAVVTVGAVVSLLVGSADPGEAAGGFAIVLAAVALGVAFRYRARARARELDQVALRERERLARDLHDTVAHHVSAIAIRAQAGLATAAAHPEAATDALRLIESEASSTLGEMRGMVRALRRDDPAELVPSRTIPDLRHLAGAAGGGPAVDVVVTGDVDGVSPAIGAAVYRLTQEAITNARRHARRATRIDVRVLVDDARVHLRIGDDGETRARSAGAGFGLLGMGERAHLLGGTFHAGPDPAGGWTVEAVLPRRGPA